MKILLLAFASVPFPLDNKKLFENNIESTVPTDEELKPTFIYEKEENVSIDKIHLDLIKKGILEFLQNKNYSEIQKLIVLEKYTNDYEEKIKRRN
jgi:hypothetical protein